MGGPPLTRASINPTLTTKLRDHIKTPTTISKPTITSLKSSDPGTGSIFQRQAGRAYAGLHIPAAVSWIWEIWNLKRLVSSIGSKYRISVFHLLTCLELSMSRRPKVGGLSSVSQNVDVHKSPPDILTTKRSQKTPITSKPTNMIGVGEVKFAQKVNSQRAERLLD